MPLFAEKKLFGFFILKKGHDNTGYSGEEIIEIQKIKKYIEICMMNILLKMNLQEENNLMKNIINQKTNLLKKKYRVIKDLLKQQADFIAITSHEIRTPLNIALLQTNDLIESSSRMSYQECEDLSVVSKSLERLKSFVQQLFDVQQYEFNKVKFQPEKINISEYIEGIYNKMKPTMVVKSIQLKLVNHAKKRNKILADPCQLRQVICNLISNSYKFSERGSTISLETEVVKKYLTIKVVDNGPGVPDEKKKSIFNKFRTQKGTGGLGLGLYLCKKITELHKGKIWVEDNPKGGSMFMVQLPLK